MVAVLEAGVYEEYLREIAANLGLFATWPVQAPMSVGDIGIFKDNRFHKEKTLASLGVKAEVKTSPSRAIWKHKSVSGATETFKSAGSAPIAGSILSVNDAGFTVHFTRGNAVLFAAVGCRHEQLADVDDVGTEILARVTAHQWKPDYFVITEVVRADSATVLMSKGENAQFEATVDGKAHIGPASIGDARVGLAVRYSNSLGMEIVADTALSPLFTAYHVHRSWLRDGVWTPAKAATKGLLHAATVDEVLTAGARRSGSH